MKRCIFCLVLLFSIAVFTSGGDAPPPVSSPPRLIGFVEIGGLTVDESGNPTTGPAGPIVIRTSPSDDAPVVHTLVAEKTCIEEADHVYFNAATRASYYSRRVPAFVCRGLIMAQIGYSSYGVHVYDKKDDWCLVGLGPLDNPRYGWLSAQYTFYYTSIDKLLERSLTYATSHWDKVLYPSPDDSIGGTNVGPLLPPSDNRWVTCYMPVDEARWIDGDLWLRVRIVSNYCEAEEPKVIREGWIRAFSPKGYLNVWFYPGGC